MRNPLNQTKGKQSKCGPFSQHKKVISKDSEGYEGLRKEKDLRREGDPERTSSKRGDEGI